MPANVDVPTTESGDDGVVVPMPQLPPTVAALANVEVPVVLVALNVGAWRFVPRFKNVFEPEFVR